jgi:hypothetical protein
MILAAALLAAAAGGARAADPNPALTDAEMTNWELFLEVNSEAKTAGNNNALFETWASDADTFQTNPTWPTTPSTLALKPRALGLAALLQQQHQRPQGLQPQVVVGTSATPEETRRNKPDFDFILANNLYKVSGLAAAYAAGKTLSFPTDSIEVKANWVLVEDLKNYNGFAGTPADAAKVYHVNSVVDPKTGKTLTYALLSMHVISKLVPNWTWATFEHKDNPGRCDVLGCADSFGAVQANVAPKSPTESAMVPPNGGWPPPTATRYADCDKTPALKALFAKAHIDPAYINYCMKGAQTDFTDPEGLVNRVGNSVTENGFVANSSCMSCHSRAAFDASGQATSFAGFDATSNGSQIGGRAPIGPPNAAWYFVAGLPPSGPMLAHETAIARYALAADFVWSIPFCAIDDTATPPQTTSTFCGGK